MARHRVQLEAKKATGKAKENLLQFLKKYSELFRKPQGQKNTRIER